MGFRIEFQLRKHDIPPEHSESFYFAKGSYVRLHSFWTAWSRHPSWINGDEWSDYRAW